VQRPSVAVLLLMYLAWVPAVGQDQAALVAVEKPKYDPTWREEVDQIARQQAAKIAQERANPKPGVTYGTPTVTDKDGNVLNDDGTLWAGGRESKALKFVEGRRWQVAKYVSGSKFAALAILDDLKPVR